MFEFAANNSLSPTTCFVTVLVSFHSYAPLNVARYEVLPYPKKCKRSEKERCLRGVELCHCRRQVAGSDHVDATFDAQLSNVRVQRVRQQTTRNIVTTVTSPTIHAKEQLGLLFYYHTQQTAVLTGMIKIGNLIVEMRTAEQRQKIMLNTQVLILFLPPPRRLCFCQTLFVCLSVCLSVCLCVSKITQKVTDGSF